MTQITREQFINLLKTGWGSYLKQFQSLSVEEQNAFLVRQGYAGLAELLAHVVAWWQDGSGKIAEMRADPAVKNPDYDVDSFNAQALRRFAGTSGAQMEELYETQRLAMLDLVESLSPAELADERINTRLYYEIVAHLQEHALDVPVTSG
jgi:hypothetical protein